MNQNIFHYIKKLTKQSEQLGFVYTKNEDLISQLKSEIVEVEEVINDPNKKSELEEEVGDMLLASINLCSFLKLDPKETLAKSVQKYQRRLEKVEKLVKKAGLENLKNQPREVLMKFWKQAKAETKINHYLSLKH